MNIGFGNVGMTDVTSSGLQNTYAPTPIDRGVVTMNKPLKPWGYTRFHKALAVHIHDATRLAGHGHEAPNYGIMESENDARKWDIPHVPADHARQVMKEATK